MFCMYCGKTIRDDADFCSYCGRRLNQVPIRPTIPAKTEEPARQTIQPPAEPEKEAAPVVIVTPKANPSPRRAGKVLEIVSAPEEWGSVELGGPVIRPPRKPIEEPQPAPAMEQPVESHEEIPPKPVVIIPHQKSEEVKTTPVIVAPPQRSEAIPPHPVIAAEPERSEAIPPKPVSAIQQPRSEETPSKSVATPTEMRQTPVPTERRAPQQAAEKSPEQPNRTVQQPADRPAVSKPVPAKQPTQTKPKKPAPVSSRTVSPLIRHHKSVYRFIRIVSLCALALIPLAVFVPYCQIAYSASRMTTMSIWQLFTGATYSMGASNPLVFTLKPHPELIALMLIPLFVLLPMFFRRSQARYPLTYGMLIADGLLLIIWNGSVLNAIRDAVTGLRTGVLETHVESMNGLVIKWIQTTLKEGKALSDTFVVYGRIGHGLLGLFGWMMLLMGIAGLILWVLHRISKRKSKEKPVERDDDDADVPEL